MGFFQKTSPLKCRIMIDMVIGLLPLNHLDTFISNLEEQDVPEDKISVAATSPSIQANFTQFTGSLHGISTNQLLNKLGELGMPKSQANQLTHAINNESAIVAVDLEPQDWLLESFHDQSAQLIWSSNAT